VLVLIGATEDGAKELLAMSKVIRESTRSWPELPGQLKRMGLSGALRLAIGDGSLGFWIAVREEYGPIARATLLGPLVLEAQVAKVVTGVNSSTEKN
jgi:transposase-like protein